MSTNGPFSLLEDIPLILILIPAPGAPELAETYTPATVPCSACSALIGLKSSIVLLSTTATDPVTSFLAFVP